MCLLSPSSVIWYRCKSRGGDGRLWKRCGLASITPGASPLPAQDQWNGDEHRTRASHGLCLQLYWLDRRGTFTFLPVVPVAKSVRKVVKTGYGAVCRGKCPCAPSSFTWWCSLRDGYAAAVDSSAPYAHLCPRCCCCCLGTVASLPDICPPPDICAIPRNHHHGHLPPWGWIDHPRRITRKNKKRKTEDVADWSGNITAWTAGSSSNWCGKWSSVLSGDRLSTVQPTLGPRTAKDKGLGFRVIIIISLISTNAAWTVKNTHNKTHEMIQKDNSD